MGKSITQHNKPLFFDMNSKSTILTLLLLAMILVSGCGKTTNEDWAVPLHEALKGATRLRVRSGGTCHRRPNTEKTLLDIQNPKQVAEVIKSIQINANGSGFHCMCCGNPSLEFYREDTLLVTLGFHHGQSVRWQNGKWSGDALLTKKSADSLVEWLSNNGVKGPLNEINATKKREQDMKAKLERATKGMPKELKEAITKKNFANTLKKVCKSEEAQVDILLSMLGASNDSWSSYDWIDQIAGDLLKSYTPEVLQVVVRKALLGHDRQRRRGAARLWESWRSPLEDWNPSDKAKLHSIILTIQQESAYYPLRQQALGNLLSWRSELTKEEVDKRLQAGLLDPHESVRRKAMLTAGRMKYKEAIPHILKILKKEPVDFIDLPNIPPEETLFVASGFDDVAGKRDESEVAALALGYLMYKPAIKEISSLKNSPMKDVALALLGATGNLKADHFRLKESNKELQLAAVEAVVRTQGGVGLEWAMNYEQSTHWWEPEFVAKRLKDMLLKNDAPGRTLIEKSDSLEDLKKWYKQYGRLYLEKIRKRDNVPNFPRNGKQ